MSGGAYPIPQSRRTEVTFDQGLDESTNVDRKPGLLVALNVLYRPFGTVSKRPGTSISSSISGTTGGIRSGYRWYRGVPSTLKQTIVQNGDKFYTLNDGTGAYTLIETATAGTTPAYYCSFYDPAESYVGGTPESDICIYTNGSEAPRKWDGANAVALSGSITNPFTGCETWNDHVWFWGDPSYPTTLFASDIFNPEGFTFMTSLGGYQIGRGDGDPLIQRAIGMGYNLVILKADTIWMAEGFDFTGEAQFTFQPMVTDNGTSNGHSVAALQGQIYFWSGAQFMRYAPGNTEAEPIGLPIVQSMAKIAVNNGTVLRAVAGSFIVDTVDSGSLLLTNVYICAVDLNGTNIADTLMVFDLDASAQAGRPMWTILEGFTIGSLIKYDPKQGDIPTLYAGDTANPIMRLFGGNATADSIATNGDTAITPDVVVGRFDFGTPDQVKKIDRAFLRVESNAATFSIEVTTDVDDQAQGASTGAPVGGAVVGQAVVGTAVIGTGIGTIYQSATISFLDFVRGANFEFEITESSTTSAWSLESIGLHFPEESVVS